MTSLGTRNGPIPFGYLSQMPNAAPYLPACLLLFLLPSFSTAWLTVFGREKDRMHCNLEERRREWCARVPPGDTLAHYSPLLHFLVHSVPVFLLKYSQQGEWSEW